MTICSTCKGTNLEPKEVKCIERTCGVDGGGAKGALKQPPARF